MTEPRVLAPAEIDALRKKHVQMWSVETKPKRLPWCDHCFALWPCGTANLLATLDAREKR
jgi:hypothetical protein